MASAFQRYAERDEEVLFASLRTLAGALFDQTASHKRFSIDPDDLDFLSDNMFIVRTGQRFGAFRFEYGGPTWQRMTRSGNPLQVPFAEFFGDERTRRDLEGYAHVARIKLPHLSRNQAFIGGRTAFYTRLLMPQMRRGQVVSIIGTTVFHDVPVCSDLLPVVPCATEKTAASC